MEMCGRCLRRQECALCKHVAETLPFVLAVLANHSTDWDKKHDLGRVLRGGGSGSPGFVEDAVLWGLMSRDDIEKLLQELLKSKQEITVDFLCKYCFLYLGPVPTERR